MLYKLKNVIHTDLIFLIINFGQIAGQTCPENVHIEKQNSEHFGWISLSLYFILKKVKCSLKIIKTTQKCTFSYQVIKVR